MNLSDKTLGLIRIARGKRALFLLDEPDTHLNPHWQHAYLDLIREWTEVAADTTNECHIVMTSHNPLTIAALEKEEVRIMNVEEDGKVQISPPMHIQRGSGLPQPSQRSLACPQVLMPKLSAR